MTTRYGDLRRVLRNSPNANFVWHVAGALTAPTTTLGETQYANKACRLVKAVAVVETAPTGASLIVDVNDDGTSVFGGTKLVVAISATVGTQTTFAAANQIVAAGSKLTVDVDQVGSSVAGSDLTVHLYVEPL